MTDFDVEEGPEACLLVPALRAWIIYMMLILEDIEIQNAFTASVILDMFGCKLFRGPIKM